MKNNIKKTISIIMAILTLISTTSITCFAGTEIPATALLTGEAATSGTCGENLTWYFDEETGTLTISGEGEMEDYYYSDWGSEIRWDTPWSSYRLSIKKLVIENGVTYIGNDAFAGCKNLANFSLPDSVVSIGGGAFSGCSALTTIVIPDTVKNIGYGEIGDQNTLEYLRIPITEGPNNPFEYEKKTASEIKISDKELVCKWSKDTQRTVINIGGGITVEDLFIIDDASGYVKEITLDESNKNFKLVDGVLYNSDMSMLLIYPTASEKKTYVMPDTVKACLGSSARQWSVFNALYLENLTLGANFMTDIMSELLEDSFENAEYIIENLPTDTSEEDIEILKLGMLSFFMPSGMSEYVGIGYRSCAFKTFSVSENNPYLKSKNGFLCYKTDKYDAYILNMVQGSDKVEFTGKDVFTYIPPSFCAVIDEVSFTNEFIENKIKMANLMLQVEYEYIVDEDTEDADAAIANYLNSTLGMLFMGFKTKSFNVPEDNKYLTTEDGILFTKDKSVLIQYPMASERTAYTLPEIDYIAMLAFSSAFEMGYLKNPDLTIHFPKSFIEGKTKFLYSTESISAGSDDVKYVLSHMEFSIGSFCFESKEDFETVYGMNYDEYKAEIDAYNEESALALSSYNDDFKNGMINEQTYIRNVEFYDSLWSHRAVPVICGGKHNIIKYFTIDEVENTEVKFGETLTLNANLGEAGLPEGCTVEWSIEGTGAEIAVSEDTLSCTVKCVDSGEVTVTAKVVDSEGKKVTDEYGNDAVDSQVLTLLGYVPYTTIAIDKPKSSEVKFSETLTLTANFGESGLPEGCKVEWAVEGAGAEITVSEDTLSCTVKCVDSGEVTVTAKVVDKDGNTVTDESGNETMASQTLTMNANFFVRVEAFFKYLWNLIVSLFK